MGVIQRLESTTPKLQVLQNKATALGNSTNVADAAKALADVDAEMCKLIDYIFDADLADKCADGGTMYDVFNGKFRYEYIIDKFMALYEASLSAEYNLMKKRISKYAKK